MTHDCNQNIESNMTPAHCSVCGKYMNNKEIEEMAQEFITAFVDHPASKHINSALTMEWIRNGKQNWEGETTEDFLKSELPKLLIRAYTLGQQSCLCKDKGVIELIEEAVKDKELDAIIKQD